MDIIEVVGAALVSLYLTWVVITALRRGAIRYRTRVHQRTAEPKTYWATVTWFAALALMSLGFAVVRGVELFN